MCVQLSPLANLSTSFSCCLNGLLMLTSRGQNWDVRPPGITQASVCSFCSLQWQLEQDAQWKNSKSASFASWEGLQVYYTKPFESTSSCPLHPFILVDEHEVQFLMEWHLSASSFFWRWPWALVWCHLLNRQEQRWNGLFHVLKFWCGPLLLPFYLLFYLGACQTALVFHPCFQSAPKDNCWFVSFESQFSG